MWDAIAEALSRQKFAASGWECSSILDALDRHHGLYNDRVSQIQMDHWTRGRIALVGDAAFCLSSRRPGVGACDGGRLCPRWRAQALERRLHAAFTRYQERLHGLISTKQSAALTFASFFAPHSRLGMAIGNQVMRLMALPFVAELAVGQELKDGVELPEY
jgi:2-polyprenyl-6-methoxyphenol hydroxylase-like FAD-dependent oxidoreductase